MNICALELKIMLTALLFEIISCFNLSMPTLRGFWKLTYECELYILPNTKVCIIEDYGKSCIKIRLPLAGHLFCSRLINFSHLSVKVI